MKIFHIIALALVAYLLSSCEEVIDIDLNESDPQVVIEAVLRDRPNGNQVMITETGSYFNPGEFPAVSNALVKLIDEKGNEEVLTETEAGLYPITQTLAESGMTYRLEVSVDGQDYAAESIMQKSLELDSLSFQERQAPFGGGPIESGFVILAEFNDPPGDDNFLLFETVINGELQPDLFLYDGRQSDGERAQVAFITLSVQKGDQIKVNTYAIDRETYDYYNTLASLVGAGFGGASTTPANPTSNWSNDALGFFGTLALTEFETIVE